MKTKRFILVATLFVLSLTLMGCPKIKNSPPELVKIIDGEIIKINSIDYEHTYGESLDPEAMVQYLIDNENLTAIDYDQSGLIIGQDRKYFDISDQIEVVSFYDIWDIGDDANFDGTVDALDEEYYGLTKTDIDGNPVYDADKLWLAEFLPVDTEIAFTLKVTDEDGDFTTLSGNIVIVE
ncbi:hypothetical protein ACAG96_05690 [Candidatus Izemoplasma sp. B36]|uniref:hypothetical protein n=1 Tax=Candidatus Izemoplasma sp. B36 TaxID=3242468 RepID=UPI003557F2A0